jgi:hypothetical protein
VGKQMGEPGFKPTVRVGEAAMREVAAYLLDHGHFSKVPRTVLVRTRHPVFHVADDTCLPQPPAENQRSHAHASTSGKPPAGPSSALTPSSAAAPTTAPWKEASLQEFVSHDFDCSEHGTSTLPKRAVHRIGVLDLRLYNTDRHAGNILARRAPRRSSQLHGTGNLNTSMGGGNGGGNTGGGSSAHEETELVPIDHGFCLPEKLEPPYFEWLYW